MLTACASLSPAVDGEVAVPAPRDEIAEAIVAAPVATEPTLPQLTEAAFIDSPPGDLELLLGAPALTRREGAGEFQRYDTSNCRVYAVVFPTEGGRPVIKSLSVGPVVAGDPDPVFASCFVTGS